jgi:hypothetical protein
MTQPAPPTARDVAKQLDRRRVRRKATLWTGFLGLIAAGAMYLRCGHGFGLGPGSGDGDSASDGSAHTAAAPTRCTVRVAKAGITVGGKSMTRDEAAAACKAAGGGADLVVTGDAREGDWTELYAALVAAGVTDISRRELTTGSATQR